MSFTLFYDIVFTWNQGHVSWIRVKKTKSIIIRGSKKFDLFNPIGTGTFSGGCFSLKLKCWRAQIPCLFPYTFGSSELHIKGLLEHYNRWRQFTDRIYLNYMKNVLSLHHCTRESGIAQYIPKIFLCAGYMDGGW